MNRNLLIDSRRRAAIATNVRHLPRRAPAEAYARVHSVRSALPAHYYTQREILAACRDLWGAKIRSTNRLDQFHRAVRVDGRHLALPLEERVRISNFTEANDAFIRCAVDLGSDAVARALSDAGLAPHDVDHIYFTSITGIAAPSIDARVANRLGFRPDVKRTPIFGLGCVGGAAGIARASDYVRAYPDQVAVLLSVELCSLTLQRQDFSARNFIASGLFGDGAAAVVIGGKQTNGGGAEILASGSVLYPNTEDVMGWDITEGGFKIVLSADVPLVVRKFLRRDIEHFLAAQSLTLSDIESWVCHPGGPKVLDAVRESLDLPEDALAVTWDSLRRVGNVSSASVLMVLEETARRHRPRPGSLSVLMGMGPGFCSELVLLRW